MEENVLLIHLQSGLANCTENTDYNKHGLKIEPHGSMKQSNQNRNATALKKY